MQVDKGLEHFHVEIVPLPEVISYGRLVEAFSFVQELSYIFWGVRQQTMLYQVFDTLEIMKDNFNIDVILISFNNQYLYRIRQT